MSPIKTLFVAVVAFAAGFLASYLTSTTPDTHPSVQWNLTGERLELSVEEPALVLAAVKTSPNEAAGVQAPALEFHSGPLEVTAADVHQIVAFRLSPDGLWDGTRERPCLPAICTVPPPPPPVPFGWRVWVVHPRLDQPGD